jgi:hypothetical protein
MIIKFPTGLYDLPSSPSDNQSVTFLVSNLAPPRTSLVYPKIPPGIVDRKHSAKIISLVERRGGVGDLIFNVSRGSRVQEGSNSKQFEIGQVLVFGDSPLKSLSPMLVSEKTETQHDLNRFDYEALGLTDEEQQLIKDSSIDTHDALTDRLNVLKKDRADAEVEVNTQQKLINEATRNIEALEVIADSSAQTSDDVLDLIGKLTQKKQTAFTARDTASELANALAAEAESVVTELRTVATVLK